MNFGDMGRDVSFLLVGGLLVPLLGLVGASVWLASVLRRRRFAGRSWLLVFLACASLALIVAATLLREAVYLAGWLVENGLDEWPGPSLRWSENGWERLSYEPFSSQVLLNAALFVPAGVAWTLLIARAWRVTAGLIVCSLGIEVVQGLASLGVPDVADLVANSVGAALGATMGTILLWVVPGVWGRSRPSRQAMLRGGATAGAVLVTVTVLAYAGAAQRQASLEHELSARFTGTTLRDFRQWEAKGQLYDEVFEAVSVSIDGQIQDAQSVSARYPASFFGVRRCVFVRWTAKDVEVQPEAGRRCTDFLAGRTRP